MINMVMMLMAIIKAEFAWIITRSPSHQWFYGHDMPRHDRSLMV